MKTYFTSWAAWYAYQANLSRPYHFQHLADWYVHQRAVRRAS
jgi:hypothetical protein